MVEPALALRSVAPDDASIAVRVNFGVFSGRHATPAEIDELARLLAHEVDEFTILAEERHEFADAVEASVYQVRVELAAPSVRQCERLAERIVEIADRWARACIADRSVV